MRNAEQKKAFYFEQKGGADCMLIASGKILLAHRAILSQRSPQASEQTNQTTKQPTTHKSFIIPLFYVCVFFVY